MFFSLLITSLFIFTFVHFLQWMAIAC